MKIILRLGLCARPLADRLGQDTALARLTGATPNPAVGFVFHRWIDADSGDLETLLRAAADLRGKLDFLADLSFTAAELRAAPWLEAVCRSTVGQSRADGDAQREADRQLPLRKTSRWPVRLPDRVFLSASRQVKPDRLSHVDQWTGEYVAGTDAADALRASGLEGWTLRPVLHPRTGAAHAGAQHLHTDRFLPPALVDGVTTFETLDDGPRAPGTPRRYGCLVYSPGALDPLPADFARTAEPWAGHHRPGWAATGRVRDWMEASRVRGWGFRPLLVEGSPMELEHRRRWDGLLASLGDAGARLRV